MSEYSDEQLEMAIDLLETARESGEDRFVESALEVLEASANTEESD